MWLYLIILLGFMTSLDSVSETQIRSAIYYRKWQQAAELYQDYRRDNGEQEELLTALAIGLMSEGMEKNEESAMLALFGAGISLHESAYVILEKGIESKIPVQQWIALKFLSETYDDQANLLIKKALSSAFFQIQMEALFLLAKQGHCDLAEMAETTMIRLPVELHPLFAQIFAACNGKRTQHALKKMLQHGSLNTQIEATLSCAQYKRDDLLPSIRMISTHPHPALQEACAFAMGMLGDQTARKQLNIWLNSPIDTISLSAARALYQTGERDTVRKVMQYAQKENLFAIRLLGQMGADSQEKKTLISLLDSQDFTVRLNAALSLLELREVASLGILTDLLSSSLRGGYLFLSFESPGTTLNALKISREITPIHIELWTRLKEQMLALALELKEEHFLMLAKKILDSKQTELIPFLMQLLQNTRSAEAIHLLESARQTLGCPLVRQYSLLELYRISAEPQHLEALILWVRSSFHSELIQFRPVVSIERDSHTLTPIETSRLLIDTYELIIKENAEKAIVLLLDAIKEGHPKNRYALAGLILRALG